MSAMMRLGHSNQAVGSRGGVIMILRLYVTDRNKTRPLSHGQSPDWEGGGLSTKNLITNMCAAGCVRKSLPEIGTVQLRHRTFDGALHNAISQKSIKFGVSGPGGGGALGGELDSKPPNVWSVWDQESRICGSQKLFFLYISKIREWLGGNEGGLQEWVEH